MSVIRKVLAAIQHGLRRLLRLRRSQVVIHGELPLKPDADAPSPTEPTEPKP